MGIGHALFQVTQCLPQRAYVSADYAHASGNSSRDLHMGRASAFCVLYALPARAGIHDSIR